MDIDTNNLLHNELETKAGIPLDAVVTHGEMMRAFEAFKETNDQRLEKRAGDVVRGSPASTKRAERGHPGSLSMALSGHRKATTECPLMTPTQSGPPKRLVNSPVAMTKRFS